VAAERRSGSINNGNWKEGKLILSCDRSRSISGRANGSFLRSWFVEELLDVR